MCLIEGREAFPDLLEGFYNQSWPESVCGQKHKEPLNNHGQR